MQSLGRFQVTRKLGSGNQGTVYLCVDPKLQRQVAIKHLDRTLNGAGVMEQDFLREARAISRIIHPNIVSVFDVGKEAGRPYLVFEYVEGELLSDSLSGSPLSVRKSLDVLAGLLSGLDRVHRQGIVHRDLKPSNIILTPDGMPKIMDFGIAGIGRGTHANDGSRIGTPRYMAPEYITDGEIGAQADVFALGAILFEMLTGRYAFEGEDIVSLFQNICNAPRDAPSKLLDDISQRLDAIVLKALEKAPTARFRDAGDFSSTLLEYRESAEGQKDLGGVSQGTVEFLMRRMQHKSDFPVLSESIRTLNRLAASDEEDIHRVASVIIKDFALTNKILRVVNSAYYSRFAGKIGTVSRAIVVLGIKTIRSIASSLIFFEHLHNKTQVGKLKDEIAAAVFSATLARQAAEDAAMEDVEEGFLCGMLHNLGEILVTYYLHDESEEISRLVGQEGMDREQAQTRVLGITFEEVGIAIAKQWNFPSGITGGMVKVDPASPGKLKNKNVKLRLIAGFANEAARLIGEADPDKPPPIKPLLKRYRSGLAISDRRFDKMLNQAREEFRELGGALSGGGKQSPFLQRLTIVPPGGEESDASPSRDDLTKTLALEPEAEPVQSPEPADIETATPSPDAEAILTDGVREVTAMLLDDDLNLIQLFNVVTETIYRAMAFHRVVFCLKDASRRQYVAKLGFGADIEDFTRGFRFPVPYSRNVFHAALKNNVDLYISDTKDPKIAGDIPGWYKKISSTGSFILFPLVVSQKPLGLVYADHPLPQGMNLRGDRLNLLKALRNQVVLAFRTRM